MATHQSSEPAGLDSALNDVTLATVQDLEHRRWQAVIDKDLSTLQILLAEELVYTHTNSRVDSKASLLNAIAERGLDYQSVIRSNESAACFTNLVVLAGRADIEVIARGVQRSLSVRYSAVWAKQLASWQFVCWHSTAVPPPEPANREFVDDHDEPSKACGNPSTKNSARAQPTLRRTSPA
jgi:hypothetical protein